VFFEFLIISDLYACIKSLKDKSNGYVASSVDNSASVLHI
ncbi:uncharacterized protein METZ01_LOCUS305840, partial [marine metagenome]